MGAFLFSLSKLNYSRFTRPSPTTPRPRPTRRLKTTPASRSDSSRQRSGSSRTPSRSCRASRTACPRCPLACATFASRWLRTLRAQRTYRLTQTAVVVFFSRMAAKKFDLNDKQKFTLVSSFIILRYFNPAILVPEAFGLSDRDAGGGVRRSLTLVNFSLSLSLPFFVYSFIFLMPAHQAAPKLRQRDCLWRQGGVHGRVQRQPRQGRADHERLLL